MSGSFSSTLGTSTNGNRPPAVPSTKGKLHDSSFSSSRGTPATRKRKLGSLFTILGDLIEGELDSVANRKISYLTDNFLHTSECISTNMAAEADKLYLNERYSRALKAVHDVSASHSFSFCLYLSLSPPLFFFTLSFFLYVIPFFSFCCRWPST